MALPATLKKRLPLIVGGVVGVALIVGGVVWWQGKQRWEGTDNAFVQADTVLVSPRISGSLSLCRSRTSKLLITEAIGPCRSTRVTSGVSWKPVAA